MFPARGVVWKLDLARTPFQTPIGLGAYSGRREIHSGLVRDNYRQYDFAKPRRD